MWSTEEFVGEGFMCERFQERHPKVDGFELFTSKLGSGCVGATRTGLDTRLLAVPGSLGELLFGGTAFGFSHARSLRASLWKGVLPEVVLVDLNRVDEAIIASVHKAALRQRG